MNKRFAIASAVAGFAVVGSALVAAPAHAVDLPMYLDYTVFNTKTSVRVDAGVDTDYSDVVVDRIRATAEGRSCTTTLSSCVITGLSAKRGTTVSVVAMDAAGTVVSTGSIKLGKVRKLSKTRVILCKRQGNQHAVQAAGIPFIESSKMKARVKFAPSGKALPKSWRKANDSWINVGALKSGVSYKYRAQAWNVFGWAPATSGTFTAGQGCM